MKEFTHAQRIDRATGALLGLAIGDAMGMPSQTLTRSEIRAHYGVISEFVSPFEGHPVSHGLSAGQITDDTEQSLLLAARLIASPGQFDQLAWANELLAWEADVKERGLYDLLGPSSKEALTSLVAGVSAAESGKNGTTNGAAMRIAPIGLSTLAAPVSNFVDKVEETCRVTHNTAEAIAAAAAVACVISCGVSGASFEEAVPHAILAAKEGATRGFARGELDIASKIQAALDHAAQTSSLADFADRVGSSVASYHSVPAAFGLVRMAQGDPWRAACLAANIGDDTDTIGAIATAMAGACAGAMQFPSDKVAFVKKVNKLDIASLVLSLLSIRNEAIGQPDVMEKSA